jgi:multidrug efflux pump
LTGTALAVIFVPIFFVVVRGFFKGSERQRARYAEHARAAGVNGSATAADQEPHHD